MSQAVKKIIKTSVIAVSILFVLSLTVAVAAEYLNTNRDTRMAPKKAYEKSSLDKKGYQKIYSNSNYEYFFRDDRDIIAIKDKKTDYIWKTGLDSPFSKDIQKAKESVDETKGKSNAKLLEAYADATMSDVSELKEEGITADDIKKLAKTPQQDSLNGQYTAMANSLITIEYYTGEGESMTTTMTSSAAEKEKDGKSIITKVNDDGSKWKLKATFAVDDYSLDVVVYITFNADGSINYNIPNKEITDDAKGKAKAKLKDIMITPFLGASGGALKYYNKDSDSWDKVKFKELTPGYVLVPDGAGALMRFEKNKAKFTDYEGVVYGQDPASAMYYQEKVGDAVPIKQPTMPVFGISHGDGTQSAFVAYAESGDEYMTVNVKPSSTEKNKVKYTYAFPSFKYNSEYYQVMNQAGDSYRKVQDVVNNFDISITYKFLSGDGKDGSPSADYVGMAQAYKEYLLKKKILTEQKSVAGDIPIRIDFLMSDSKKGVFSTQEVDVTTSDDVNDIIKSLLSDNIHNINSGLIGWQSGGEILAKPASTSVSSSVGSLSDFEDIMKNLKKKNVDLSFSRDFVSINEDMMMYYGNAAKHLNTRYLEVDKTEILPKNAPVTEYGYADPLRSAEWIEDLYDDVGEYSPSLTIDGASNSLLSTHDSKTDQVTVSQAIKEYQKVFANIQSKKTKLNMVKPNQYLWKYTNRFLQSDVGTTQYVYETDTVPFLQMVLNGSMEVYAPYSNFSFYSKKDMLRMIDYNISPSFVLTKKPSYLLAATASADYYSTEYSQYEDLIKDIYGTVNGTLKQVKGCQWIDREVLEDGVIANTYKDASGKKKTVIVNYTNDDVTAAGMKVKPLSASVKEGGVK